MRQQAGKQLHKIELFSPHNIPKSFERAYTSDCLQANYFRVKSSHVNQKERGILKHKQLQSG